MIVYGVCTNSLILLFEWRDIFIHVMFIFFFVVVHFYIIQNQTREK